MRSVALPLIVVLAAGCGGGRSEERSTPSPAASQPSVEADWLGTAAAGAEPTQFVVLAGHWRVREEAGSRMLRVDGTDWKAGLPGDRLDAKAIVLFPRQAREFLARVRGGLQFPTGIVRQVESFGNGELSVDFRLIGGASDQYASLLFGMTPDANHYAFRYNTKDGDAALWRVVDGERERLHHGGVPVAVALGEWQTLRMRIAGADITGWVGDVEALRYSLPSPVTGRVGLWSKADSVTDYRDYRWRAEPSAAGSAGRDRNP